MKLTKTRLKQIIKEELQKTLKEQRGTGVQTWNSAFASGPIRLEPQRDELSFVLNAANALNKTISWREPDEQAAEIKKWQSMFIARLEMFIEREAFADELDTIKRSAITASTENRELRTWLDAISDAASSHLGRYRSISRRSGGGYQSSPYSRRGRYSETTKREQS